MATGNAVCCQEPRLFTISLTAQRIFAIKTRRINNQAAVSQDYLLGRAHFVRKRIAERALLPCSSSKYCIFTKLLSTSLTAQRIFAIKTRRINNQAAVSQDYLLGEAHFVRKRKILSQFSICHCEEQRICDVAIQRSEMRLRLDSHATALQ